MSSYIYVVRMILYEGLQLVIVDKYIYNEMNCIQRDDSEYFDSENLNEDLDASAMGLMGSKGSNEF